MQGTVRGSGGSSAHGSVLGFIRRGLGITLNRMLGF
jgi:hypothetical protein